METFGPEHQLAIENRHPTAVFTDLRVGQEGEGTTSFIDGRDYLAPGDKPWIVDIPDEYEHVRMSFTDPEGGVWVRHFAGQDFMLERVK